MRSAESGKRETGSALQRHDDRAPSAVLLVASGKGGVGTSLVASLSALALAQRGENILLVDDTEGNGALHLLFGARPACALWNLYERGARVDDALLTIDAGLTLVAGGTTADAILPPTDKERRAALTQL